MFDHKEIDKKWQAKWEAEQLYKTPQDPKKKKYILDMFPYPSGAGLHVGHPEGYTATDIISRYSRMNGFDVLHPMGWDAFGLPAENYAIKQGVHPAVTTKQNIDRFREQIKAIGLSYDWSREVNTSDPAYYKWTQWMFLELYKKGLAYKKEAYVNWCPKDQTVLANEQVVGGVCDRCSTKVEQKLLSQWFFKITDYAQRLLNDIEKLDWPLPIKQMQKNWIGKSEGARIKFLVLDSQLLVEVFTTRPDTLFGATYLVLAPEHPFVSQITKPEQKEKIESYIAKTRLKTDLERTALEKNKTGEFTGAYAVNPATEQQVPIWIADYVLSTYGTGAIMAVPAHDERDFEFAKTFSLPIKEVIKKPAEFTEDVYTGEGQMLNSGEYSTLTSEEARIHITADFGKKEVQYRLRDWLVSRQRYWGAPIPIIYCDDCGMQPVPYDHLPVKLPTDVDFKPTGESPLVYSKEFHQANCPNCGKPSKRDSDTMDTFVDSSWYFLRYADPGNDSEFASKAELQKWVPVDVYQGGAEHAVLHLLYARFITKFLLDAGHLSITNFEQGEPFLKLRNQGLILGPDGEKMSKSKGNVINPDDVIAEFGADAFRMYEMFMGPLEDAKPWSTQGIVGVRRFLDRVYKVIDKVAAESHAGKLEVVNGSSRTIDKAIKSISKDIESSKFNTAISSLMIAFNERDWAPKLSDQGHFEGNKIDLDAVQNFLKILAPFAPHVTEELWNKLTPNRHTSIHVEQWPSFDESKTVSMSVKIAVQINGKTRTVLDEPIGLKQDNIVEAAKANESVKKHLEGKEIVKEIYVQDKLINFVVK